MLDHMLEDRVTLVKKDGTVSREEIPSLVTKGKVQIHDATIPIEVGDHLLRKLPNGFVEDYIVDDPVLHAGLGRKLYVVHVHRTQAAGQRQATIQNITNNFHGANSRSNVNSIDLSLNTYTEGSISSLKGFVDQVRSSLGSLPEMQRTGVIAPLAILEDEVKSGSPTPSVVKAALQSLKAIVEGATGNLIAVGIVGMINSM